MRLMTMIAYAPAVLLALAGGLVACSAEQQAKVEAFNARAAQVAPEAIRVACAIDGVAQPVAAVVVQLAAPGAAGVVQADKALLHPLIERACAAAALALGKPSTAATPVSAAVPTTVTAPPETAPAAAPPAAS